MSTITERLSNLPMGRFHWILLIAICSGWDFDGMDTGIIAFILPKLMMTWHLTPVQAGFVGSFGLVGMAVGSMLSGTIGDYIGRKKVFAGTLILYSLATGACGLAWSYESLLFFRFLVGFGLGGQIPVAVTLLSEFAPIKERGRMIVILESSWAIGWLIAGILAYVIIPRYGWQVAFFVGTLPVLYAPILWRIVPESPMYLMRKGRIDEAHAIVSKIETSLGIEPGTKPSSVEVGIAAAVPAFSIGRLFSRGYLKNTICLWILWFGHVFSYYGIFMWLPTIMVQAGHEMLRSFEYLIWMSVVALPGYFIANKIIATYGRKSCMVGFVLLFAATAFMFGRAGSTWEIYLWSGLLSIANQGVWGVLYAYTPESYPTEARSTGVGWAAAWGRIGGMIAPVLVGMILTGPDKISTVFTMFTGMMLIVAATMLVLGTETKQNALH